MLYATILPHIHKNAPIPFIVSSTGLAYSDILELYITDKICPHVNIVRKVM